MRIAGAIAIGVIAAATVAAQPAATLTVEQLLSQRLGVAAADVSRFTAGEPMVLAVPAAAENEVAAVGAIRAKGDWRRMLAWMRDIESFMRASGTETVGAINSPASAADFARLNIDSVDFSDLQSCKSDKCDIRMPAAFLKRFQSEVAWSTPEAQSQAAALARALLIDYVTTYQKSGDAGLGALHDPARPNAPHTEFLDLLRRSTKVWEFSHPFATYLESFPANAPPGTESRFYWTRETMLRKPVLTLHHVVLQELPGGRVLAADKQFYASRQFDAGLLIAFGVPNADFTSFDLVVSVKARASAVRGIAGRLLRRQIEGALRDGVATYLQWIKDSAAL